jgi:hypothetical protein
MTHLKRVALGVAVAGVLSGAGSATASAALPEFVPGAPAPFTSTIGAATFETAVTKVLVQCTNGTNEGEITSPNTVLITIRLKGCHHGEVPCNSPNGVPGEIQYVRLTGTLGYIRLASPTKPALVGLDLSSPAGALLTSFSCGAALNVNVRGSMIGAISPINKVVLPPKGHFVVKWAQLKGHQKVNHFAGGPLDFPEASVNGGPIEASGLTATDTVKLPVPEEIKA